MTECVLLQCAFVNYFAETDAAKAIEVMNGFELDGQVGGCLVCPLRA